MLVLCFQRSGNDSTSNEIAFDMLLFGRLEQNFFTCLNFSKALFFCIILMMSCPVFFMSHHCEVSKNGSLSARIYEVCAERDGLKGQVRDYERVRRAIGPEQADRILEAAYQQEQVEKEQKWGARSKIRVGAR